MADNIKIDLLINAAQSAKTIQETKKALRDLKSEAMNLTEGSAAFTKVATAAGQLQDKIGDLSATTKYLGDDLRNIKAIGGIGQGIAAGFGIATGAAALFGNENKNLQESMVKLQAIMAVVQGMEQIGLVLQKESAAMLGIQNATRKVAIFLTSEQAVAEAAEAVAAGTATVAQKALNLAMKANPIGILITLILAGVAALTLWSSNSNDAARAEKKANEEKKKSIELSKAQNDETEKRNSYISKEIGGYTLLAEQLKKSNPGSAERLRLIKEMNSTYGTHLKNLTDEKQFQDGVNASVEAYIQFLKIRYQIQASEGAVVEAYKKQLGLQEDILDLQLKQGAQEMVLNTLRNTTYRDRDITQSPEYQQLEATNKLIEGKKNQIAAEEGVIKSAASNADKLIKIAKDTGLQIKDEADKTNKSVVESNDDKNKAIEEANIKALERAAKIEELRLKGITDAEEIRINLMEDGFEKESALLRKQENDELDKVDDNLTEIKKLVEESEIDKLKIAGKYITDKKNAEYEAQKLSIDSLVDFNEDVIAEGKRVTDSKTRIEEDYAKKHRELNEKYIFGPDYLKVVNDNASYEQKILNEKFKNNELSGEEYLKSTQKLADDLNIIQDAFNKDPGNAFNILFQIRKEPLKDIEAQADAIKSSTTKTAEELIQIDTEKNKKLAENQVKANEEAYVEFDKAEQKKIDDKERFNSEILGLEAAAQAAALSIFNNAMDQRSKANQKEYDNKIALIDAEQQAYENSQANRTTLQQAQYDAEQGFVEQRKNAERKRQIEEDKIKKKQFNAQKINDAANIAIKTALAVMTAVAEFPLTAGMPFSGIAIALGAIEEAVVLSKKYIPTYATGGLVNGPGTGTSDSINARLSNGESVINAKSTSMFAPMLSAINQAGGGIAIPHTKNNIFNPSTSSSSSVMDSEGIINAINELNNRPVETYVKEVTVTNSQNRADKLKRRTSF